MDAYSDDYPEGLRPLKVEFSPYISKKLKEIAKTMGITEKEALRQLVEDNLKTLEKQKTDSRRWKNGPKERTKKLGHSGARIISKTACSKYARATKNVKIKKSPRYSLVRGNCECQAVLN